MMIGTVFFLAIASPILAIVYPTTTSYDRETNYQPQTPRRPSNTRTTPEPNPAPGRYNPSDNNPGQAPSEYNPDRAPGNNNPGQSPGNYNPGQSPGNYNPNRAPGNNNPGQSPGNYNPGQAPGNYNPGSAPGNNNPRGNPQNYNPTRQESGYGDQPSSGPYNAQDDPYTNYPIPSTRNIRREIADASAEVASASKTNQVYQDNLRIIGQKINMSSNFRQKFEDYLYQQLVDSIEAQEKKIADYRSQVDDLSNLNRDVTDLVNKVNSLTRNIVDIRKRQANIGTTVGQLGSGDGVETLSIVTVEDQTDGNDEIIEIIRGTNASNSARYDALLRQLEPVVQTVNDERVEVYTLVLTASNSSVFVKFDTPFTKQPQVAYGIIGLEIDEINDDSYGSQQETNSYRSQQTNNSYGSQRTNNSYGNQQTNNSYGSQQGSNSSSSQQERIFPRVVARADTKGVTVSLIDNSVGWITEYVRVRLLVAYVNNDKISTVSPGRTY